MSANAVPKVGPVEVSSVELNPVVDDVPLAKGWLLADAVVVEPVLVPVVPVVPEECSSTAPAMASTALWTAVLVEVIAL